MFTKSVISKWNSALYDLVTNQLSSSMNASNAIITMEWATETSGKIKVDEDKQSRMRGDEQDLQIALIHVTFLMDSFHIRGKELITDNEQKVISGCSPASMLSNAVCG